MPNQQYDILGAEKVLPSLSLRHELGPYPGTVNGFGNGRRYGVDWRFVYIEVDEWLSAWPGREGSHRYASV